MTTDEQREQLSVSLGNYYFQDARYRADAGYVDSLREAEADIELLCQRIALEARIDEGNWLSKNAPMMVSGFPTEHIDGKGLKARAKQLKSQLRELQDGDV